jgi:membrane protein implicated in regulation of membrane protease activity
MSSFISPATRAVVTAGVEATRSAVYLIVITVMIAVITGREVRRARSPLAGVGTWVTPLLVPLMVAVAALLMRRFLGFVN